MDKSSLRSMLKVILEQKMKGRRRNVEQQEKKPPTFYNYRSFSFPQSEQLPC